MSVEKLSDASKTILDGHPYTMICNKVLEQIKEDVNYGNLMAIEELMKHLPEELLEGFLGQ